MLNISQILTAGGPQGPLFLPPNSKVCFALEGAEQAEIQLCYGPPGSGWQRFEGGLAGCVYGASALRVRLKPHGEARLQVNAHRVSER